MKKLTALLCVMAAILVPTAAEAFTLYTPEAPEAAGTITCSIINVGPIPLEVQVIPYRGSEPPGPIEWGG